MATKKKLTPEVLCPKTQIHGINTTIVNYKEIDTIYVILRKKTGGFTIKLREADAISLCEVTRDEMRKYKTPNEKGKYPFKKIRDDTPIFLQYRPGNFIIIKKLSNTFKWFNIKLPEEQFWKFQKSLKSLLIQTFT